MKKSCRRAAGFALAALLADLGVEAVSSTPEQFGRFIKDEMDKYARLIKDAGIRVNP